MTAPDYQLDVTVPLKNPDALTLLRPEQYFQHFAFQDQTLARAGDVNEMQNRIEAGFVRFGTDIAFLTDNLIFAMLGFAGLTQQRQDRYEVYLNGLITALRKELLDDQTAFKAEVRGDLNAMRTYIDAELQKLRTYIDAQDATMLDAAHRYSDSKFAEILRTLVEATRFGIAYDTGDMDDGNITGGTNFTHKLLDVPTAHTLKVHRWTYSHRATGRTGYATDSLILNWPNFAGYRTFSGNDADFVSLSSGAFTAEPIYTVAGPATIQAIVTINNFTGRSSFGIEGYLVPDSYSGLPPQPGQAGT